MFSNLTKFATFGSKRTRKASGRHGKRRQQQRQRTGQRLLLEVLEDRRLLATYDVTSPANWSALAPPPTAEDDVIVRSNATLTVDVNNAVAKKISLGSGSWPSGSNGTLSFNSDSVLTIGTDVIMGTTGLFGRKAREKKKIK